MKRMISNKKISFSIFILLLVVKTFVNAQVTVPDYNVCPNQTVLVTATWNNVGNVSYTLFTPIGSTPFAPAPTGTLLGANTNTIIISHAGNLPTPGNPASVHSFTIVGTGQSLSGIVTSTAFFNITVTAPPPLNLVNQVNYCPGETAVITAPSGGQYYNINSPCFNATNLQFPVITIPNLTAANNCTYVVTSVGSCTATGITTINVAPSTPITVNSNSNVCQCGQNNPGNVNLTASLTAGSNWEWLNPLGVQISSNPNASPNHNIILPCIQPNMAGVYTVKADFSHPSTTTLVCPRSATTLINVVATSPINVSASPGTVVCQGGKVSFNAGASPQPNGWSWAGPQSFAASISNPTVNPATPLNNGAYTVNALFTNNAITCITSTQINISVVPVAPPIINMPSDVCSGGSVSMSVTAASNVQAFDWFGPGFTSNIQAPTIPSVNINSSGSYIVTVRYGLSPFTNPLLCPASASAQLNVIPVNSVSVVQPPHVCPPDKGVLQASAIGANQYAWFGPGGFSANSQVAYVYNPTSQASGIYTVIAYFNGGNITCQNNGTLQLTVGSTLDFSLSPRQQVCYNTPVSVTGPAGATSYTWSSTNGYSSNSKDLNLASAQPVNSGIYSLKVSLGQCVTSASTVIDVLSPLQFTLLPQNRSICALDTTYFEVGMSGGSENYAYRWNPAAYLESDIGPRKRCVPEASVLYNVVVYDIACPNYTVSHSFNLNVNQPPKPNYQLARTEGCEPFFEIFNPQTDSSTTWTTVYDFGNSLKYQTNAGTPLDLKTIQKPLYNGIYTLTTISKGKNGCSGTYTLPYPIIVNKAPKSSWITEPESPTTIDEVTFIPNAIDVNVVDYLWSFNGGKPLVIDTAINTKVPGWDTSNVKNPVRIYEQAGRYPVSLISTTDKGCLDTVIVNLVVIDDFRMYIPNSFTPNGDGINDIFTIKASGMKVENFNMEVLDRWGNSLFFTKDYLQGWDGKISGKDAEVGTYIYRINAVGLNGEGRREFVGHVNVVK
jgi:gliding motility-associated-like protein